jgi:hypothetical protein
MTRSVRGCRLVLIAMLLVLTSGCRGCDTDDPGPSEPPPTAAESGWLPAVSLVDAIATCDVDHRGALIDMGSPAMVGRHRTRLEPPVGVVDVEHDGATWARIYEGKLTLTFHLPHVTPVFVALRGIGRDARIVNVAIDGYLLDALKLDKDAIATRTSRTTALPLDAGLHRLELRFRGGRRSDSEPYAEIDWIRIGVPDELTRTYGAPTLDEILVPDAQLGGVPHRGISLHAPGSARCTLRVPPGARLRTAVGVMGGGKATAAVVIHRRGTEKVLERVEVAGGPDATWTDVEVPLQEFAYEHVTIELSAVKSAGNGRLVFGDPTLFVPSAPTVETPRAAAVVVVFVAGVTKTDLPPWRDTETPHLHAFRQMAQRWTVFDDHRAPSTLVSAVAASFLTGLSPRSHSLVDPGARLPSSLRTLGAIAREGSVRGAMFTSVPTTFGFFGFDTQWEKFVAYPPNEGRAASSPMDDAAVFATEKVEGGADRPVLAVLHVRGGHPPWDVTPDEAAKLPPTDYSGLFGPRRAAQQLAELDGRHSRMGDGDRERLRALFFAGVARQDRALARLFERLEEADLFDRSLIIVTGDVASSRQTFFADGLDLEENLLSLPLYVHFPGGEHAGQRVERPTEIYDLTRTVLAAVGVKAPAEILGHDLSAIAAGFEDVQRVRVAFRDDQYSARWGAFVLRGRPGEKPHLCELDVDPTCSYDRTAFHPTIAQALFRRLALATSTERKPPDREPLTLDSEAAAMLDVWGAY